MGTNGHPVRWLLLSSTGADGAIRRPCSTRNQCQRDISAVGGCVLASGSKSEEVLLRAPLNSSRCLAHAAVGSISVRLNAGQLT
jgi:hypothetical protein